MRSHQRCAACRARAGSRPQGCRSALDTPPAVLLRRLREASVEYRSSHLAGAQDTIVHEQTSRPAPAVGEREGMAITMPPMTTKERLHMLVDELSEAEADDALLTLTRSHGHEGVLEDERQREA